MQTEASPVPISTVELRRFHLRAIDPGRRVNLCELTCAEPVPVPKWRWFSLDKEALSQVFPDSEISDQATP